LEIFIERVRFEIDQLNPGEELALCINCYRSVCLYCRGKLPYFLASEENIGTYESVHHLGRVLIGLLSLVRYYKRLFLGTGSSDQINEAPKVQNVD